MSSLRDKPSYPIYKIGAIWLGSAGIIEALNQNLLDSKVMSQSMYCTGMLGVGTLIFGYLYDALTKKKK